MDRLHVRWDITEGTKNFIFLKSLPDFMFGHADTEETIFEAIHKSTWKRMEKSGISNLES